ncbi:MAG TPA: hypothetical protein PL151_04995 [Phycisphaerae bacterium]|nr:hypothetical protein [Phycisphaerae bacterium]HOJ75927.1 hypothetical protein [Phycisphaerae bacterium]HOM52297.1 hypothetical protein [Phycisphaerae bacterium]HON65579.1 hypothetical protein [Phycisphaerae bacterium]HOQ84621.1 hypothetical protein [Phycisphaerae bacterium]
MALGANVQSIEALKAFRIAVCKLAEAARSALAEADADLQRHGMWLSDDRRRHWQSEIRKRGEQHRLAKMALLQKQLQAGTLGARLSCVDEEKAVALAQRRLEEAHRKSANTVRWIRQLEEQVFEYKGLLQALNHALDVDVANGLAWLDRMTESLEAYVALAPPSAPAPETEGLPSMARTGVGTPATEPAPDTPAASSGHASTEEPPPESSTQETDS